MVLSIIVDTQKAIVNDRLYGFKLFESNVKRLIYTARQNNVEVIYVRHDDGEGAELTLGNSGFGIYDGFAPACNEKVFDKTANSAFKNTGLAEYLKNKGEDTVIIAGLQTDYCIDATVKAGFEHGFKMIVPANANSTFDNPYMTAEQSYSYYNEFMWNKRYADCISFEQVLVLITNCSIDKADR